MKYFRKLKTRLRDWALRVLGGVDRKACVDFANEYLFAKHGVSLGSDCRMVGPTHIPRGAVIYGDRVLLAGVYVSGQISVAPWCCDVALANVTFEVPVEDAKE